MVVAVQNAKSVVVAPSASMRKDAQDAKSAVEAASVHMGEGTGDVKTARTSKPKQGLTLESRAMVPLQRSS